MEPGKSNRVGFSQTSRRPRRRRAQGHRRHSDGASVLRTQFASLMQSVCPEAQAPERVPGWSREDYTPDSPGLRNIYHLETALTRPSRFDILLDMAPASLDCAIKHAWNSEDSSPNITVKDDQLTFHKRPSWSTDCIRGKIGITEGLHIWEIFWPRYQRWVQPIVGVATKDAPLHCVGTQELIGCNDQSWGWDITFSKLHHDSKKNRISKYPVSLKRAETFYVPDKFLMALDMDEGTLSFIVNGQYLGVAFSGLRGLKLYPIVSGTWGYCDVRLRYVGGLEPKPQSLMDLCRNLIRTRVGKYKLKERISQLGLPRALQDYLLHNDQT